jgi:hypothetical protein
MVALFQAGEQLRSSVAADQIMRTKRPGEAALLLLDAAALLQTEKIAYAVIGAMAASVHGVVRTSIDADAVLSLTAQALVQ